MSSSNALIHEKSPYLLQHAHNPVDWHPWGKDALDRAQAENKLIIVSIGYSACHWCHVMEHESFEDPGVAAIMNEHFVCIKIDREERPDIDQVYMIAVQLMTGGGGWPLNCICLPDQRPVYGGTYFRRDDWKNLLLNLAEFWRDKPAEAIGYAEKLTQGVRDVETPVDVRKDETYTKQELDTLAIAWKRLLDPMEGGYARAPKFPLPNTWQFMMRYAVLRNDEPARILTRLTLEKMAHGGIYDHIGGGFARYSVDGHWHVPHFEKMLYDNAQLLSLYSEAWQWERVPLFKSVVYETADWLTRELLSAEGGFYSALDADSEGVEGKFYTFTTDELAGILGDDTALFEAWFHTDPDGNWEEEHTNVFFRRDDEGEIAAKFGLTADTLHEKIGNLKQRVFAARGQRVRPGLDDKLLAAWNGLALRGFADAYRAFGDRRFLDIAVRTATFLENMASADGAVRRSFHATGARGVGFLDDHAFVADGLIRLYEVTLDEKWLLRARAITEAAIAGFHDEHSGLFYYTSSTGETLIARKFEIMDNVIPSSNSAMAHNLWRLGHFFDDGRYHHMVRRMLAAVSEGMFRYPSSYSNWAGLLLEQVFGVWEMAITGPASENLRQDLETYYLPNKIVLGGEEGTLPLLAGKPADRDLIYVCRDRSCLLPAPTAAEAVNQTRNP